MSSVRVLCVVVAVAFAAWPGAAGARITTDAATIDGVTSTSAPPGSVMNATVTADVRFGSTWSATGVRFGAEPSTCFDHANQGRGSNRRTTLRVTAPGPPGDYDAAFTPNEAWNCRGRAGTTLTLQDGLRVTTPGPNPKLPPRCGINVMLVLDESGSIQSSGQTRTVKAATRAFLDALSGTGAKVSIVDFGSTASRPVGYTTVTAASIAGTFEPYLATRYRPSGYTNWEAAFQKVREANTQGPLADLVVFITDGDPTARNTRTGTRTGLPAGDVAAMRPAAAQADLVKEQGSHVFAMGVGAAVTKKASADRLTAISGPDKLPPSAFSRADFTLVQDFDDLAEALRHIANELCRASVTITKLVDEGDGQYKPDRGWDFTAAVSTSPSTYAWLQPAPPPERGPRTVTTDADGVATFQWQPTDATATSTITIAETQRAGYRFVSATCTRGSPTQSRRTTTRSFALVAQLVLGPNEHFTCAVRNQIVPGTIEIEKQATPQGPTSFPFSGSLGDFSLVDDDTGDSASKVVSNLPPGTYTVQELVPAEWELSGVTCTPARAATISAAQVAITLTPGGSVVCTYSDLRVQPPVEPEPTPTPTPTPGPTPSPSPVPPAPAEVAGLPVAALRVVKAGPRVARVGDRVPFALTVTNMGANAAMSVQVADVPPAAVTLTGLSATAGMRRVRGNAVWRLGTLAPGASRTVRGSVLIKAGTPGLKRNLALATAANAHLVSSRVDTRVLGPLRPSFTG